MTALFTKGGRASAMAALLLLTATVGGAFAQKYMTPGSNLCVSKNSEDNEGGCEKTVQAAVNKATMGQVIEILDESVYEEQVTIDGRSKSPWPGVVGNKDGITIRYVPAGGAAAGWNHPRPTIKWRDTENTHPRSRAEATQESETTGAGNWETCGALRVIRAKGVKIEGIAVDGGSPFTFGTDGAWCDKNGQNCSPLNHGNAAISLVVAGQATIRDCDLKNAFFGINVKDRNTGGVFGNPNPADNDTTVPLSGFGQVGGHLFEYNKVNANVVGFFFESAWDLGSTARYNLIFNNKVTNITTWNWVGDGTSQKNGGAFMFKDMYLSPVAIYNNTFYDNTGNFIGHWQSGGQHLIFNNIISKSSPGGNVDHMSLDKAFPNRMHNNVFSVDAAKLDVQCNPDRNCTQNSALAPGGCWVSAIQGTSKGFGALQGRATSLTNCNTPSQTIQTDMVAPGAKFTALDGDIAIDTNTNVNRWLQTEGATKSSYTQVSLFKSLISTDPDFLVPNWDNTLVQQYIKNQGWADAGIRNNDGSMADLGAIPSTGVRQTTVGRIFPTSVVLLSNNGANADANFSVQVISGEINSPKIKLLRWIAPVPANTKNTNIPGYNGKDWPDNVEAISKNAISVITSGASVKVGNNSLKFTTGKTTVPNFGFFEVIVEGTDKNGKTVTSDIGFLPYRALQYFLDITVLDGTTPVTTVTAGKMYTIRVSTRCAQGTTPCPSTLNEVEYSLLSHPTAFMINQSGDTLSYETNVTFPKDYTNMYFSRAGDETILGSGTALVSGQRVSYMGTLDLVVKPGDPAKAVFRDPNPLAQMRDAPAQVINRGVTNQEVRVEVQDIYGNAVDKAVRVTVNIADAVYWKTNNDCPDCGIINGGKEAAASTDVATGIATFLAGTTSDATSGKTFDMTATLEGKTQKDTLNVGRLRVGRSLDRLMVFYSDTLPPSGGSLKEWQTYYDENVKIEGKANDYPNGDWFKITVKVVVGDTVKTAHQKAWISVESDDPGLVFSATPGGASPNATVFELENGVATFWVSTAENKNINASITVRALTNASGTIDGSVTSNSRGDIIFNKVSTSIAYAVVYGDGQGRPDSVRVQYRAGSVPLAEANKPTSVTLEWGGATLSASSVNVRGDAVLQASFTGDRPTGYTSVKGLGTGLVTVTAKDGGGENGFDLHDGIGPVLGGGFAGDGAGSSPRIYSNEDGYPVDTLEVFLSEPLRSVDDKVRLSGLLYADGPAEPAAGAAGTRLDVLEVIGTTGRPYKLVVSAAAGGAQPKVGGWIRLDAAGDATDEAANHPSGEVAADNPPRPDNRWVQLKLKELPPDINEAWYTGNVVTGRPNFVYVEFKRTLDNTTPGDWFKGGSVRFADSKGGAVAITDDAKVDKTFDIVGVNTLRIDLSEVSTLTTDQIKTSGQLQFTLQYNEEKDWPDKDFAAADRSAPVMALDAELRKGTIREDADDKFEDDTLVVYYSEPLDPTSAEKGRSASSLTLKGNGKWTGDFRPTLELLSIGYDKGFQKAMYKVLTSGDKDAADYVYGQYEPETGDSVHINEDASVGDDRDPSNIQDSSHNRWVKLTVISNPTWKVKIKNNPLVDVGTGGGRLLGVEVSPNVSKAMVKVNIRLFDNVGALVRDTTVENTNKVEWTWDGTNSKGRWVGTGTYLLKASCVSTVGDDRKVYKMPPKAVGVVRGKAK